MEELGGAVDLLSLTAIGSLIAWTSGLSVVLGTADDGVRGLAPFGVGVLSGLV